MFDDTVENIISGMLIADARFFACLKQVAIPNILCV
jgi:hypothetical protein